MESAIKRAKNLVRHGKVVQVSENIFDVEEHIVSITKRSGSCLISCDCLNHSRNVNSPAFCLHKFAVITYLANRDFLERLKNLSEQYEGFKTNKLQPSVDCFIDDLNSIREKW
jgi:hypothetical protein